MGARPCSSILDFSTTTWARSSGDGIGIARGSAAVGRSTGVGDVFADSILCGVGVFSGFAFSFVVFVSFALAEGLFFAVDLCFVFDFVACADFFFFGAGVGVSGSGVLLGFAFGLGVGVGDFFFAVVFFVLRFGVAVGDSSESAERVFKKILRFSSSLSWA